MGLTHYGADLFLNQLFGKSQTTPATLYVGLVTVRPDQYDTGSTLSEPSGGAYARVALANSTAGFAPAEFAQKTNAVAVDFPVPTADWGLITHWVLCDASTGGQLLLWGTLHQSLYVETGLQVGFEVGTLQFMAFSDAG